MSHPLPTHTAIHNPINHLYSKPVVGKKTKTETHVDYYKETLSVLKEIRNTIDQRLGPLVETVLAIQRN